MGCGGVSPVGHRLHIADLKLLLDTQLIPTIIQQVICELWLEMYEKHMYIWM